MLYIVVRLLNSGRVGSSNTFGISCNHVASLELHEYILDGRSEAGLAEGFPASYGFGVKALGVCFVKAGACVYPLASKQAVVSASPWWGYYRGCGELNITYHECLKYQLLV